MKIALLCSLVLAAVFIVEAGELCSMDAEKMSATLLCMREKLPTEIKEKMHALNKEETPFPEFVKKHCDLGTNYMEVFKKTLSEEEIGTLKTAYTECISA